MIDLTGYSPEALEALERALDKAKGAGAGPGGSRVEPVPQIEDIKPGMTSEETARVARHLLTVLERR